MLKFHFFMAVWGDPYIETMVRLTIPTMLYPGNIPAIAARHSCKVIFYTRAEEEAQIRQAPSVARLAEFVAIEFVHVDPSIAPDPHRTMSDAHHHGAVAARIEGARGVILAPDMLFADGTFSKVGEYAEQGKVAVICPGPRLLQESVLSEVAPRISHPIPPRALVKLMLVHLHPEMLRYCVDSRDFSTFPAICYWNLGKRGILIRGFHLHPLMIDFSRLESLEALSDETIDGALLGRSLSDWSDVHVETDSDNLFLCSLTPRKIFYSESRQEPFDVEALRQMVRHPVVNALHRSFFSKAIKCHVYDLDRKWHAVEQASAEIDRQIDLPPSPPSLPSRFVPGAADKRLVRYALSNLCQAADGPVLVISRADDPLALRLRTDPRFDFAEIHEVAAGQMAPEIADRQYSWILCHAVRQLATLSPNVAKSVLPLVADGGSMTLLFEDGFQGPEGEELQHSITSISLQVGRLAGENFTIEERYVGGKKRRKLRRVEGRVLERLNSRKRGLLRRVIPWLRLCYVRIASRWLDWRKPNPVPHPMRDCSTAVLTLQRRPATHNEVAAGAPETQSLPAKVLLKTYTASRVCAARV